MDYRDVLQRKFRKSKTTENYVKYKIREKKLITWLKEPNKTTSKTCWMKTPKHYFILENTEKYISHHTEIKTY